MQGWLGHGGNGIVVLDNLNVTQAAEPDAPPSTNTGIPTTGIPTRKTSEDMY